MTEPEFVSKWHCRTHEVEWLGSRARPPRCWFHDADVGPCWVKPAFMVPPWRW